MRFATFSCRAAAEDSNDVARNLAAADDRRNSCRMVTATRIGSEVAAVADFADLVDVPFVICTHHTHRGVPQLVERMPDDVYGRTAVVGGVAVARLVHA